MLKLVRLTHTPLRAALVSLAVGIFQTVPTGHASEVAQPAFYYTHLVSSPFTLPAGRLIFGTQVAFGVTDFLQVGTDLLRLGYSFYNANAKLSLIDHERFAFALTGGWESFNYQDIDSANPNLQMTAWRPGAVTAVLLADKLSLLLGGSFNLTDIEAPDGDWVTSGYLRGMFWQAELSWAYGLNTESRLGGRALVAGVSYDSTYQLFGVGMSHHWRGFQLGAHFYPDATQARWQPIIMGGTSFQF